MGRIDILENKLVLHDSYIKKLSINEEGFIIQLDNVIFLDNFEKRNHINIIITIAGFDYNNPMQNILIFKRKKQKIKEVKLSKFLNILQKYDFRVYSEYFSFSKDSLLLQCNNNKSDFFLEFLDINEMVLSLASSRLGAI